MAWDARNLISTQVGAKTHPDDAEPTEIWPTNAKVNAVNRQGLERLKDPPKRFESADWVRPFKNIPPYISVDEVTHALKTCDFIKSAPAPCCLSPRTHVESHAGTTSWSSRPSTSSRARASYSSKISTHSARIFYA